MKCAAPGSPTQRPGLFACTLERALQLNRSVLGKPLGSARPPLGVEALMAHLLALEQPAARELLEGGDPRERVDRKQLDRLVRTLNRLHRTRGQKRRKPSAVAVAGAAEGAQLQCRRAADSSQSQPDNKLPGTVALCALLQFFEQLETQLVDPEMMPRVLDYFLSAGPVGGMDLATRNAVSRGLHGHTMLGLLADPLCQTLVELTAVFAHDFAAIASPGLPVGGERQPDPHVLSLLSRKLGPLVLRHSSSAAVGGDGEDGKSEEELAAADTFYLMALEHGFIFGDDPEPGGGCGGGDGGGPRRQHRRLNSWVGSQQLEPITEEQLAEAAQQSPQIASSEQSGSGMFLSAKSKPGAVEWPVAVQWEGVGLHRTLLAATALVAAALAVVLLVLLQQYGSPGAFARQTDQTDLPAGWAGDRLALAVSGAQAASRFLLWMPSQIIGILLAIPITIGSIRSSVYYLIDAFVLMFFTPELS